MLNDETRPDGGSALPRATRVQHLINRIGAHEAEGAEIAAEMKALALTPAQVKKIQATQKTLAALMGADLLPEGAQL
jgi:hypothetical protein